MRDAEITDQQIDRIRRVFANAPFLHLIGIKLKTIERGSVSVSVENCEPLKQQMGIVHGGAIASLLDTASALSVISLLEEGQSSTTVDLTIHYLRPVTRGEITATGKVIRAGKKILTVSAEVFDETGKLCATAITTYLRI